MDADVMSMPSSSHVHMEGRPYCAIPNQLAGVEVS